MRIAIIDADLIERKKHRFPNLACMKLSAYYKGRGDSVQLKTGWGGIDEFDKVFVSKVFTDTNVPDTVVNLPNVVCGGTGFYYDKAPALPNEIEHIMPDYALYDEWVKGKLEKGEKRKDFEYYLDYSIGFMTRGCFRHCPFCVNRNYSKVSVHSPLSEFVDPARKYICLLDDNFFGCAQWKELLTELQQTGKRFQFKQGLDERLLTDEKCEMLFKSKYKGDYIFAFDNIADKELIIEKLKLARKYTNSALKFYCFCGYDRNDKWDDAFWKQDMVDLFERIRILQQFKCLPYIMRFNRYEESRYRGMYITIARWCNQPSFYRKMTLREFVQADSERSIARKYLEEFERECPTMSVYCNMRF